MTILITISLDVPQLRLQHSKNSFHVDCIANIFLLVLISFEIIMKMNARTKIINKELNGKKATKKKTGRKSKVI